MGPDPPRNLVEERKGEKKKEYSLWQFKNQGASAWAGVTGTVQRLEDLQGYLLEYNKNRKFRAYGQGLPVVHSRTPVRNWGIIERYLLPSVLFECSSTATVPVLVLS